MIKLKQIYKKNEYLVIPTDNGFLIINIDKVFKKGHTRVKNLDICKSLISLAINKKLPENIDLVDKLIKISMDKDYIRELKKLKEDKPVSVAELMKASYYKRHRGAVRQVR